MNKKQKIINEEMRTKELKCDCGRKCVSLSLIDYGSFYEFVLWKDKKEYKDGFHAILLSDRQIEGIKRFLNERV